MQYVAISLQGATLPLVLQHRYVTNVMHIKRETLPLAGGSASKRRGGLPQCTGRSLNSKTPTPLNNPPSYMCNLSVVILF